MGSRISKSVFVFIDLAFFVAILCINKYWLYTSMDQSSFSAAYCLLIGFLLLFIYLAEGYEFHHFSRKLKHVLKFLLAIVLAAIVVSTLSYWIPLFHLPRSVFLTTVFLFAVFALLWRIGAGMMVNKVNPTPLLLLGCESNVRFLEYLDADDRFFILHTITDDCGVLPNDLDEKVLIVCDFSACDIPKDKIEDFEIALIKLRLDGHKVYDIQGFYQRAWDKVAVYNLSNLWFLFSPGFTLALHPYYKKLKRLSDLTLSLLGLILASPFFLIVPIMIKIESKDGVFFLQERVGLNARVFKVIKFRSMRNDAEIAGAQWASENDPRVTRIGYWLRKLRIDEIPQLINVLKGEMSLIGSRPERPVFVKQLEQEIPFYQMRHIVKPGITGWAQVNYPYGSSVEDAVKKLEYDLFYVKNHSLLLDLRILLRTIRVVIFGKGL